MSLASVASQLAASTASGGSGAALGVQAAVGASKVTGAMSAGSGQLRGVFQSIRGGAQARANLITGGRSRSAASAIPSDGTRCEECGNGFTLLSRRSTCTTCDRYICGPCLGRHPVATMSGFNCFCGSLCAQCRSQNAQAGEFELCRHDLEQGANVTLGLPKQAGGGFFGGGGSAARTLLVWLTLNSEQGTLQWGTLEQRQGRPLEEGAIPVTQILGVRNTGVLLEVSSTEYSQPITMEFSQADDRDAWARHLELAAQVLTPESERASLDEARASHRHKQMDERRSTNEERKKKLQEGLGMRFTAEAMMQRDAAAKSSTATK